MADQTLGQTPGPIPRSEFLQALKEQLGLKLDPKWVRMDVFVIDYVEATAN